ncbi:hypothetical protein Tco_1184519 [Tanacetum coccineum]
MGSIDSLKVVLTQSALDDLCEKYYIPDAGHPGLPGPSSRIRRSAEMNLFAFIHHADPTKVKIGEREIREGEVPLLELTKDHVVPLAGMYDQGDVAALGVDDEAQALVADKPKKLKKRKTADGAGGSGLPPKNTLTAEVGVTAAATIPLVTSSVAPILEHEGGEYADFVSVANVRTGRPTERFVISSDTHDSNVNVADDEVSSIVRSTVPNSTISILAILTIAVATIVVAGTSISLLRDVNKATHASIFADYTSVGNVDPDATGPSQPSGNDISSESFYVSLDMDSEALRQAYLRAMEYDQLLSEFDVGAAHQTCLSAEVRMHLEHLLRGKKRLEDRCGTQEKLLKERDLEIADLRAHLSLKEAEEDARACELGSLKEKNVALEFAAAAKDANIAKLSQDLSQLQLEVSGYQLFKEQIEEMQDAQVKVLSDRVASMNSDLMALALHMDEEFYPRFLKTLAGRGAIGRAIEKSIQDGLAAGIDHGQAGRVLTVVTAYDPFAEANYLAAINDLRSVEFSLLAQLESRKDASIIDIIDLLHLEGSATETLKGLLLQPSPEQLMVPIHRLEDQVVIREISLSDSLEVAHNRVQRLKGDVLTVTTTVTTEQEKQDVVPEHAPVS